MAFKVMTDKGGIRQRVQGEFERKALPALTQQILDDSNDFARFDNGALIASSALHSDPNSGHIEWRTPYARRVYYTGTPFRDKHHNASLRWVEVARRKHGRDWEALANKRIKEG